MEKSETAIPAQGTSRRLFQSPAGQWMAVKAVNDRGASIALACRTFSISESCYHYERKLSDENAEITDWLEKLTIA